MNKDLEEFIVPHNLSPTDIPALEKILKVCQEVKSSFQAQANNKFLAPAGKSAYVSASVGAEACALRVEWILGKLREKSTSIH